MTKQLLFPRLNDIGVQQLVPPDATGRAIEPDLLIENAPVYISWGATGGRRISVSELLNLRNAVLDIANTAGFPRTSSQVQRAQFDADCGAFLHNLLPVGEALRDDVWAYLATVLMADICLWRFPNARPERFFGGVRNTFQRLWLRARAFDRGPDNASRWQLLSELSEDAMVQVTERPSIGADPRLALAVAEGWLKTATKIGKSKMEGVARDAIRNLRIENEVLYLASLEDGLLEKSVLGYFSKAAARQ